MAALALGSSVLPESVSAVTAETLVVGGEVIGMAEVRGDDPVSPKSSSLAVILADDHKPKRRRFVQRFRLEKEKLVPKRNQRLWEDAAGFDVCRLPGRKDESFLILRPGGVYELGEAQPVISTETIFAHSRDDRLPRVHLCFSLFPGEEGKADAKTAVIVPTLRGIEVYQWTGKEFGLHARIETDARLQIRGQLGSSAMQRINVGFEFPDLMVVDYDGDDLQDICLAGRDYVECHIQDAKTGLKGRKKVRHDFDLLTDQEKRTRSLYSQIRLVQLGGDKRVDVVFRKSMFNISDMFGELWIFPQKKAGGFDAKPAQKLRRDGYFAYQQFIDMDGNEFPDIVSPVKELSWSSIAAIYLTKSLEIRFVWFKGEGTKFADEPKPIREQKYPVDFKNISDFLGALPIWRLDVLPDEGKEAVFFPERAGIEVMKWKSPGELAEEPVRKWVGDIGSVVLPVDLDGDGLHEIAMAYPTDPKKHRSVSYVNLK